MIENAPLEHGGNIATAERLYGKPSLPWIDLSTGINPRPYPHRDLGTDAFARLPDDSAFDGLREAAAIYYGTQPACLAPVPGTQALLQWLPQLRPASRVGVVGPTYEEHAHTWREAGHDVTDVPCLEDLAAFDVGVIVNPNNPDGKSVAPEALLQTAADMKTHNGWLIVDEAFGDVCTHLSVAHRVDCGNLIVLKSLGKFFGLAGLRLGFAITAPDLTERILRALGPWAVSGPALEIGARALADKEWIEQTKRFLDDAKNRLDDLLTAEGFSVVGGTSLFRLAGHPDAPKIYDTLAREGILVRRFPYNHTWLRFGLPGPEEDWLRLVSALGGLRAA